MFEIAFWRTLFWVALFFILNRYVLRVSRLNWALLHSVLFLAFYLVLGFISVQLGVFEKVLLGAVILTLNLEREVFKASSTGIAQRLKTWVAQTTRAGWAVILIFVGGYLYLFPW
jgi:hypothetical protein